jgi:hypothetical protein
MKIKILKIFFVLVTLCLKLVTPKPISVPVDNTYSYNNNYYDDVSSRHPNAHFNRLPQNSNPNQAQVDDVADSSSNNDYDYEDQQTDKPVISSNNQQQSNYNNLYSNNYLLTENRIKHKKKRRIRRPCIPIQSYGSPLFSNRLKRQTNNDAESGKTLGLLLGGGGYNNYYQQPYYQHQQQQQGGFQQGNFQQGSFQQQQGGYQDNVKPQYDSQGSGQVQYGQAQYQSYGGYPCIPVSTGYRPGFGGGGLFGGGPFGGNGLFGGGGLLGQGGGGLLGQGGGGLLGQGGLLDFGSPGPLSPAGIYQGAGSYPQTVIINRPPLFGNLPNYNRPGGSQSGGNYPQDSSTGGSSQQPFWGSVVDKLQEFVRLES